MSPIVFQTVEDRYPTVWKAFYQALHGNVAEQDAVSDFLAAVNQQSSAHHGSIFEYAVHKLRHLLNHQAMKNVCAQGLVDTASFFKTLPERTHAYFLAGEITSDRQLTRTAIFRIMDDAATMSWSAEALNAYKEAHQLALQIRDRGLLSQTLKPIIHYTPACESAVARNANYVMAIDLSEPGNATFLSAVEWAIHNTPSLQTYDERVEALKFLAHKAEPYSDHLHGFAIDMLQDVKRQHLIQRLLITLGLIGAGAASAAALHFGHLAPDQKHDANAFGNQPTPAQTIPSPQ